MTPGPDRWHRTCTTSGTVTTRIPSFDDTRIALHECGSPDAPLVVLVHGLGLSARSWGRVPALLGGEHRVVAYDLRGHGESGKCQADDYSLFAHSADLGRVLEHVLAPGERAVVVGNSFGGGVILAYAHDEPGHRMSGVVFAGSSGSSVTLPGFPAHTDSDRLEAWLRAGWAQVLHALAAAAKRVKPIATLSNRLVRNTTFTPDTPLEAVEHVRDDFFGTDRKVLARTTLASGSHDGSRFASELKVPALVLHGSRDPQIPEERVSKLVEALPDAELVSFEGAGHVLALTHPERVAEEVARWVRRVRGAD